LVGLQNEQQGKRYRLYLLLVLTFAALVVVLWLGYRYRKNKEIEILRHEEAYRKLQSEFEAASQQAQKSQQAFQQRVMAIYKSGQEDRLKRILAEFDTIYPQAFEKLQNVHPDLTETECKIVVLSFFGFRIKEEAELLDLSVNTVAKYRTNIRKKMGSDPISRLFK
jgi:DNA-binding CsgD family transcriptional regulator